MNPTRVSLSARLHDGPPRFEASIPERVAEFYAAAPVQERGRLLERLLQPLGVLSLFGIAGGIFARIRLRSGWQEMRIPLDEVDRVGREQVIALVDHAQQVSVEAVDGLVQWLTTSPALSGSAAAALLVTALLRRARPRVVGSRPPFEAAPR